LYFASVATEKMGVEYLQSVNTEDYRLTLIDKNGLVIFDNKVDVVTMENHMDREEIKEAVETGHGSSKRSSHTLMEMTVYEATRLSDGTILRISTGQVAVSFIILTLLLPVIGILFLTFLISALVSNKLAKRITEPFRHLDLEHPLENEAYEQVYPLLKQINNLNKELNSNMKDLKKRKLEFNQVADNMKEGLILLDRHKNVLSINPAAKDIFQIDDSYVGKSYTQFCDLIDMYNAVNSAITEGYSQTRISINKREYQLDISSIRYGKNNLGAVIIAFDITEQVNAERMRREFSANVSHELKTPLQSIIGSSELLESGMVKPEDTSRFVGHIRTEASRLVTLVEDIIRLSELDEGISIPKEPVVLAEVAREVITVLEDMAAKKKINICLYGDEGHLNGVAHLLYELIYNLCDNAIKYNTEGGTVKIYIKDEATAVTLVVEDTGIGIPKEHQSRIFERFYRVDKSHSKESGGTGLGLSIVKHATIWHDGNIEIESDSNKGTKIIVNLSKK